MEAFVSRNDSDIGTQWTRVISISTCPPDGKLESEYLPVKNFNPTFAPSKYNDSGCHLER